MGDLAKPSGVRVKRTADSVEVRVWPGLTAGVGLLLFSGLPWGMFACALVQHAGIAVELFTGIIGLFLLMLAVMSLPSRYRFLVDRTAVTAVQINGADGINECIALVDIAALVAETDVAKVDKPSKEKPVTRTHLIAQLKEGRNVRLVQDLRPEIASFLIEIAKPFMPGA